LLIGFDPESDVATVHWIDTWHMGHKVMACSGRMTDNGSVDVRGTYAAPPGPDWGWRITIDVVPRTRIDVLMFNINPADGAEQLAVRGAFAAAPASTVCELEHPTELEWERFLTALKEQDLEALESFPRFSAWLRVRIGTGRHDELCAALDELDFSRAREIARGAGPV
jgi:hypothetical protein